MKKRTTESELTFNHMWMLKIICFIGTLARLLYIQSIMAPLTAATATCIPNSCSTCRTLAWFHVRVSSFRCQGCSLAAWLQPVKVISKNAMEQRIWGLDSHAAETAHPSLSSPLGWIRPHRFHIHVRQSSANFFWERSPWLHLFL